MEKLTNQKVLLLEDKVMERCGQHPMWMYLKTYQTGHAELSYEGFLLQKTDALRAAGKERSSMPERKPQSAEGLVLFPNQGTQAGKTVDLKNIQIGVTSFMEHAITNRDYQLNKSLFIQFPHEQITLEQVGFLDMNSYCDINRICRIYQEIPREQNDFGNLDDFMDWTIRSGYHTQSEFRKVIDGNLYSAKTCVWDRFTRKNCGGTIENK